MYGACYYKGWKLGQFEKTYVRSRYEEHACTSKVLYYNRDYCNYYRGQNRMIQVKFNYQFMTLKLQCNIYRKYSV